MARTPSQRGPFGNWLKRKREERYRTQADALADMKRLVGLSIAPSEFAQWEAGSRVPRPDNRKAQGLVEFFGGDPWAEEVPAPSEESELASAIRAQAAAIEKMAAALSANTEAVNVAALAVLTSQAELKGGQLELADLLGRLADGETLAELARSIRAVPAP